MSDRIKDIECPNCGHNFDVENALAGKLEEKYKERITQVTQDLRTQFDEKQKELQAKEAAFQEKKKKENELFQQRLEKAVTQKEESLKKNIEDQFQLRIKAQDKELEEKSQQLHKLKNKEIELIQLQRKMDDQEKEIELKYQKQLSDQIRTSEEKIQKRMQEGVEMRIREKDKQLEDQRKLIEEMKRKADQGSMQMQGEVMELAIEEILSRAFPHDVIEEVPKGVRGADSIQTVINHMQQDCGKIIYESKRTKTFVQEWITKLKQDQRDIGAQISVLVTQTMPKDMEGFGEYDGVWICSFSELSSLVYVLREILIRSHAAKSAEENKGDKIELLYDYLTSPDFKNQVTSIVDGFTTLKVELEKEKRAMKTIWKRREKQIEMVVDNTINMYGSIRGIAGNKVPKIDQLEFPDDDLEELSQLD